jgi:hypothetical protein
MLQVTVGFMMISGFPSVTPSGYHGSVIKAKHTLAALDNHRFHNDLKFLPCTNTSFHARLNGQAIFPVGSYGSDDM